MRSAVGSKPIESSLQCLVVRSLNTETVQAKDFFFFNQVVGSIFLAL